MTVFEPGIVVPILAVLVELLVQKRFPRPQFPNDPQLRIDRSGIDIESCCCEVRDDALCCRAGYQIPRPAYREHVPKSSSSLSVLVVVPNFFANALMRLALEYSQRPMSYSSLQFVLATDLTSQIKPEEEPGSRISIAQCAIGGYLWHLEDSRLFPLKTFAVLCEYVIRLGASEDAVYKYSADCGHGHNKR